MSSVPSRGDASIPAAFLFVRLSAAVDFHSILQRPDGTVSAAPPVLPAGLRRDQEKVGDWTARGCPRLYQYASQFYLLFRLRVFLRFGVCCSSPPPDIGAVRHFHHPARHSGSLDCETWAKRCLRAATVRFSNLNCSGSIAVGFTLETIAH